MTVATRTTTVLQGGKVVLADRVLPHYDVVIQNGRIAALVPTQEHTASPACEVRDARGCYVAPGFIDIHSDYIENVASPRPSIVMDLHGALYGVDRSLVSHGVTTIYHSLSLYQGAMFDHKPIRRYENVERLISFIDEMRATETFDHLIRHRLHVRVELDAVGLIENIEKLLLDDKVDLISFMDHTPGQGQYRDLKVYADIMKSYNGNMTDEDVQKLVEKRQSAERLTIEQIEHLSTLARQRGVAVASHDDDCRETLEFIWELGATISEFPISLEVARNAQELGMHTIAGAPNVLLGYSHSGNLSARESISAGATDILCSDYFPAALLKAVFELERQCGISLAAAFALVTINPARAVGIDDELGEIAVGKKADLLLIRELPQGVDEPALPVVEEVYVEGRSVFKTSYPVLRRAATGMQDEASGYAASLQDKASGYAASLQDEASGCAASMLDKASDRATSLQNETSGCAASMLDKTSDRATSMQNETSSCAASLQDEASGCAARQTAGLPSASFGSATAASVAAHAKQQETAA